jgi:hypothetical protein
MGDSPGLRVNRRVYRLPGAAVALSLVAFGCVRLMEPGPFRCESQDDCESTQKCLFEECVDRNFCSSHSDCAPTQRCNQNHCEAAECVVQDAPACGAYRCAVQYRLCYDQCGGVNECKPTHRCHPTARSCQVPFANGEPCYGGADCASGTCCNLKCADQCGERDAGTSDAGMTDAGATDAGTTDAGMTDAGRNDGGAVGALCTLDTDCASMGCCATTSSFLKLCRAECPPLTGDYCTAATSSARECDEANAYCDGPSNFSEDGYCSRDCTGGCGYASNGLANVCITLTTGSSPAQACKPGCNTHGDCTAIHPDLLCLGTLRKACDYDTAGWRSVE